MEVHLKRLAVQTRPPFLTEEPSEAAVVASGTLADRAYQLLREDLINGEFRPEAPLRFDALKSKYDLGLSPLREALSRLAIEGLVELKGQKGFRVAPMSLTDFNDITRVRILVECAALRESIEKANENWEADILGAYHLLTRVEERLAQTPSKYVHEWEMRNRDFHAALIGGCQSKCLLQFSSILYDRSERYRRLSYVKSSSTRNVRAEHKAIMDAAILHDADKACKALSDHIEKTAKVIQAAQQSERSLRKASK
jgi:GntR family transcriptional regulator, carbon starvation induced regulator